jgi:crossover junction endodeoxyribonuclease RusA
MTHLMLPWPPKDLSPNARVHWAKRSKSAKAYRNLCRVLALKHIQDGGFAGLPTEGHLALWLDFYPPDKRARDDDNIVAAFKSGRDGLADALGIDDKRFRVYPFVQDRVGGYVWARITEQPNTGVDRPQSGRTQSSVAD